MASTAKACAGANDGVVPVDDGDNKEEGGERGGATYAAAGYEEAEMQVGPGDGSAETVATQRRSRPPPPPKALSLQFQDGDDVHSEVTDALLGFVYDPLDELLCLPPSDGAAFLAPLPLPLDGGGATGAEWHCGKRQGIGGGGRQQVPAPAAAGALRNDEHVLQLPLPVPTQPLVFVPGANANNGGACQSMQKSAARQRRKRISDKTAELARLIPGAHKLNTAEMLEEAARHVKLLQAQVAVLALMEAHQNWQPPAMAQERMHALLACGGVQERLAAEGRCLVPTSLVDAAAKANANPVVRRDLARFVASLRGRDQ